MYRGRPDGDKSVTARLILPESMYEPPPEAAVYFFENAQGQRVCWQISTQTPKMFLQTHKVVGDKERFFPSPVVRIFFPVNRFYYATRVCRCRSSATLEKILACIDMTAAGAVAYYFRKDEKRRGKITMRDVAHVLRRIAICHILLHTVGGVNCVYVRFSGAL